MEASADKKGILVVKDEPAISSICLKVLADEETPPPFSRNKSKKKCRQKV